MYIRRVLEKSGTLFYVHLIDCVIKIFIFFKNGENDATLMHLPAIMVKVVRLIFIG